VFCDEKGHTTEKSTLKRTSKPKTGVTIKFNNRFLKTDVTFKRIDDPIFRQLFKDSKNNALAYDCHHPKALTKIIYDGRTYEGFGYSETLLSGIKPWNLPIGELRWGRFLSDSYTLIWIYWKGKYPLNKMFFNDREYNDAVFENESVVFDNGTYRLSFSDTQVIRQGKLAGLFSKMRLLKMFINHRILNALEIKYRAKTVLSKNSIDLSTDWSLFEIVTWGK
jgi:hypothetical protein